METQPPRNPARQFVSECALPALANASYVAIAPDSDICDELAAQVAALIADAGLPVMDLLVNVTRRRDSRKAFSVLAYDRDPVRNTFDVCSASAFQETPEQLLREFSGKLHAYAIGAGLMVVQTMEGSLASA